MLQNAYFLAKIGADTAESEQQFAEILPTEARGGRGPPTAAAAADLTLAAAAAVVTSDADD